VFAVLAIYGHSDHETNITIEFTLKNGSWKCITLVFARLATYGHSDHKTNITVEFTSKNGSQKCITLLCLLDLPYMVTLMMKLTSPLNSRQKMVPGDDEDSMGTPQGLHKTLKGLSGLLSRLCKVHEESMRSPWECVGDCKIQCLSRLSCHESWSWHCI
jgi:hypothetical protein